MIFFNDPVVVPNPDERVVRMALAMRDRVAHLIPRWRQLDYDLDLSIGIAQGYATIGAIGSVTNLAARLCAEAKPGQIPDLQARPGQNRTAAGDRRRRRALAERLSAPDSGVQRFKAEGLIR